MASFEEALRRSDASWGEGSSESDARYLRDAELLEALFKAMGGAPTAAPSGKTPQPGTVPSAPPRYAAPVVKPDASLYKGSKRAEEIVAAAEYAARVGTMMYDETTRSLAFVTAYGRARASGNPVDAARLAVPLARRSAAVLDVCSAAGHPLGEFTAEEPRERIEGGATDVFDVLREQRLGRSVSADLSARRAAPFEPAAQALHTDATNRIRAEADLRPLFAGRGVYADAAAKAVHEDGIAVQKCTLEVLRKLNDTLADMAARQAVLEARAVAPAPDAAPEGAAATPPTPPSRGWRAAMEFVQGVLLSLWYMHTDISCVAVTYLLPLGFLAAMHAQNMGIGYVYALVRALTAVQGALGGPLSFGTAAVVAGIGVATATLHGARAGLVQATGPGAGALPSLRSAAASIGRGAVLTALNPAAGLGSVMWWLTKMLFGTPFRLIMLTLLIQAVSHATPWMSNVLVERAYPGGGDPVPRNTRFVFGEIVATTARDALRGLPYSAPLHPWIDATLRVDPVAPVTGDDVVRAGVASTPAQGERVATMLNNVMLAQGLEGDLGEAARRADFALLVQPDFAAALGQVEGPPLNRSITEVPGNALFNVDVAYRRMLRVAPPALLLDTMTRVMRYNRIELATVIPPSFGAFAPSGQYMPRITAGVGEAVALRAVFGSSQVAVQRLRADVSAYVQQLSTVPGAVVRGVDEGGRSVAVVPWVQRNTMPLLPAQVDALAALHGVDDWTRFVQRGAGQTLVFMRVEELFRERAFWNQLQPSVAQTLLLSLEAGLNASDTLGYVASASTNAAFELLRAAVGNETAETLQPGVTLLQNSLASGEWTNNVRKIGESVALAATSYYFRAEIVVAALSISAPVAGAAFIGVEVLREGVDMVNAMQSTADGVVALHSYFGHLDLASILVQADKVAPVAQQSAWANVTSFEPADVCVRRDVPAVTTPVPRTELVQYFTLGNAAAQGEDNRWYGISDSERQRHDASEAEIKALAHWAMEAMSNFAEGIKMEPMPALEPSDARATAAAMYAMATAAGAISETKRKKKVKK